MSDFTALGSTIRQFSREPDATSQVDDLVRWQLRAAYQELETLVGSHFLDVWYVSFGVQYLQEPHPTHPGLVGPDGLVAVIAHSYESARDRVVETFGVHWSMLYERDDLPLESRLRHFPRGILFTI